MQDANKRLFFAQKIFPHSTIGKAKENAVFKKWG